MGANAQTSVPVFTSGQVLTAQQQTEINTGIPVFATSVERDAAFGGTGEKTLAEGQFAFLEDTNATQYYDGSTWEAVGTAAGLVFVAGGTFTTSAAVNVNNCFTSTYKNYKVVVQGLGSSGSAVAVNFRFRVSGADDSTANYFYSYNTVDASSTETNVGAGSQTLLIVAFAGNTAMGFDMTITTPQLAETKTTNTLFTSAGSAHGLTGRCGGTFNQGTIFDGFSLIPASGTITGTYRVYGLADA